MMPVAKLARIVVANTLRSPRQFVLSAFGIVIGIASFVFFLALSMGVRNVVLGEIFPIDEVKVIAPRASLVGVDMSKQLDDAIVEKIRARPEVSSAMPRMAVAFPASGRGRFEGQELRFEVGGFADGIHPEFVQDQEWAALFKDWEASELAATRAPCGPPPQYSCEGAQLYCQLDDLRCHHRVPVIISPTLLELYNGQFASSHGLPLIDSVTSMVVKRGLSAMRFYIGLGDTMVAGSKGIDPAKQRDVQGMLIGISDKAMPIGMTVPIQYVERWNAEFVGQAAASSYSSIVVRLSGQDAITPFSAWLQDELDLRLEDSLGERFATAIFVVTLLFILISFIIVIISAINIAHNFFMQVSERRREIGVLRAVGATQVDVRLIVLGESALIGIAGGVLGIGVALVAGLAVDAASAAWLPSFPFKPETYFDFRPWILAVGLGFSVVFCVLGGFLPARRAARMQPAQALAQH